MPDEKNIAPVGMNMFPMIAKIAANGIKNQKVREGDYYDSDGMLVCGVCHCKRQGFKDYDNPSADNPTRKTTLKVAIQCECDKQREDEEKKKAEEDRQKAIIKRMRKWSIMDDKYENATFEVFEVDKHNQKNLRLVKRYAYHFDEMFEKNQGLLFWGDFGTGKSYMAACIANYLLSKKVYVLMTSLVKLLDLIEKNDYRVDEIIDKINRAKLVIFDDLGAERNSTYGLEKIYNIIDSRYRSNKPMIITTNLTLEDMKNESDVKYGRIYDRIFEACYPIQFTGQSRRKKEALKRFKDMKEFFERDDDEDEPKS